LPSYGSVLSFLVDQGHVEIPRPPSFPGLRFGVPSRASWRARLRHATDSAPAAGFSSLPSSPT
jgi:hypothetical protein